MIKNTIRCTHCDGKGFIDIPFELKVALIYVKSNKNATARGLYSTSVGETITRSAANNRLERLRRAGLVTRQLNGREYVYFVKE